MTSDSSITIAEFLDGVGLEATLENRNRLSALIQAYALQTATFFESHPETHELLIPANVADVLTQTWMLSDELAVPAGRLLAMRLHYRNTMMLYLIGHSARPPAPDPHPILLDISATLHKLRRELLYPEIPLDDPPFSRHLDSE